MKPTAPTEFERNCADAAGAPDVYSAPMIRTQMDKGDWAILAVLAAVVVMLRTRQYRTGTEVLVGLVSGVLGLLSVALSALWLHPGWRPTAAVALAVTGAVLLALTLVPQGTSVRRGRLGDVAESVALLALLPALVIATGIFSSIKG